MTGDNIIVRLLSLGDTSYATTVVDVVSYWNDDMAYNGSILRYVHSAKKGAGLRPFNAFALPGDPNRWEGELEAHFRPKGRRDIRWPNTVDEDKPVMCWVGQDLRSAHEIPACHPLAITHLSAFKGLVSFCDPAHTQWGADLNPVGRSFWGISLQLVARRLEGLTKTEVVNARRANEVIK